MPDQELENNIDLVAIRDWLTKQPHLPNDVCDLLLRRFLTSCDYSLEKTKRTLDLFFTIRSTTPEVFLNRDPWSFEIKRIFEITDMIPLPRKTKENYKVFIYRLNNPNLDLFNFVDAIKTFFMLADTRLTEDDDITSGEIPIFDSANVSLKFIGKMNLAILRKYMLYTQEAIPIRLKQVHVINAPSYIGKIHAVLKPFLKSDVAKVIKFHEPNSTSLYDYIPQEILPEEYGGKCGTVEEIKRHWVKRIEAKRDWFLDDERWALNESRRPSTNDDRIKQVIDMPGSFRKLDLD